jgi:hypothetical protein
MLGGAWQHILLAFIRLQVPLHSLHRLYHVFVLGQVLGSQAA